MNDFKGISEVLSQFTSKQKFMVLLVLLLFSLLVSLGTVFINGYYRSSDDLIKILNNQKLIINDLNIRLNTLQLSSIKESSACTDSILSHEKRYASDMISQQKYVNEMLEILKKQIISEQKYRSGINSQSIIKDSILKDKLSGNTQIILEEGYSTVDIINSINKIQKGIKGFKK